MRSFTFFYSLCLEIPGSIFSFITLLDMMHQNLLYLYTGIHWIEHKVSRWIHDWRFAHCTYNSEWRVSDFLFSFLFLISPFPFPHMTLQITSTGLEASAQSDNVTFCFANYCGRLFFFLFVICFTSTICIETIHKLDTVPIRTFVPLLLTANTDQPRTLCLCNNNARLILIIRLIMTLITVVINFYFVYTKVGNRYGMGMHMTAVLETQKLYRSMSLYLH